MRSTGNLQKTSFKVILKFIN